MKLILLVTCFLPLAVLSQNATKALKTTIDKFRGDTTYYGNVAAPNVVIYNSYVPGSRDVYVTFTTTKKARCVDDNSKVFFLFVDNSKEWSYSRNSYNCKGLFMIPIGKTFGNDLFETLKTKKIKSVRLEGADETFDFNLTPTSSTLFMKQITELDSLYRKSIYK